MEIHVNSSALLSWTDDFGLRHTVPCALGCGGIGIKQREGDGITPTGSFALLRVMYRDDRHALPRTNLAVSKINKQDGWCDDPSSPDYNKPIILPQSVSHEKLYRDDTLYDFVVDIDYNRASPIPGKGSAIFIHVAKPSYKPTKGCIALDLIDLLELLKSCNASTRLVIRP